MAHHKRKKARNQRAVITLTARESREFVETLLNPPKPTPRQIKAAARYKREYLERFGGYFS